MTILGMGSSSTTIGTGASTIVDNGCSAADGVAFGSECGDCVDADGAASRLDGNAGAAGLGGSLSGAAEGCDGVGGSATAVASEIDAASEDDIKFGVDEFP